MPSSTWFRGGKKLVRPALVLALLLAAPTARADVSSWAYVGTGPGWVSQPGSGVLRPSLQLDAGLGTAPSDPWVIGLLLRTTTCFGSGTDFGQLARLAQREFVNGDWGLAFDLGVSERLYGPIPALATGSVELGAPWGITLSVSAGYGTNDAAAVQATLGVDLLRLTVYRRTGSDWWPNLFPAWRPEGDSESP